MHKVDLAIKQHCGSRDEQQDAAGRDDPDSPETEHRGTLAVLSDGIGGMSNGAGAARTTVAAFRDSYRLKSPEETVQTALRRALKAANAGVLQFAQTSGATRGCGATVVAAVICRNFADSRYELYWVSTGDSRAYLLRDGLAFRLTIDHAFGEDHKLGAKPQTEREVEPAELTSFIGLPTESLRIDGNRRPFWLRPGDCVLLASDGLYGSLDEAELADGIRQDLGAGCQHLIQLALNQHLENQDNITVVAMRPATETSRKILSIGRALG